MFGRKEEIEWTESINMKDAESDEDMEEGGYRTNIEPIGDEEIALPAMQQQYC